MTLQATMTPTVEFPDFRVSLAEEVFRVTLISPEASHQMNFQLGEAPTGSTNSPLETPSAKISKTTLPVTEESAETSRKAKAPADVL